MNETPQTYIEMGKRAARARLRQKLERQLRRAGQRVRVVREHAPYPIHFLYFNVASQAFCACDFHAARFA